MSLIIFHDDWIGGGKNHKCHLRKYRHVKEVPGDKYIEVLLNKKYIMKCDESDLSLVQSYRWSAYGKKLRVQTTLADGTTLTFSRLVLNSPEGRISHINKDNLDNRKSNLKILGQTYRKDLDYVVEDIDKLIVSSSLVSSFQTDWMGGIPGGSLNESKKYFIVRFSSPQLNKCFFFETYGGKKKACEKASEFRWDEAERRGLIRNKYRFHTIRENTFLEVECNKNQTFFCDAEDLSLVKSRVWCVRKRTDSDVCEVGCSNRAKTNLTSTSFHQAMGLYEVVDHIDGNPLNNRRCNLREGKRLNSRNANKRKDNSSGVTGVSFNNNKSIWVVQWPEAGKRRTKSFSVNDKVSNEEARQKAIEFRLQKDKELNLHQQQRI